MADHADYSEHPAMFKNHPFGFLIALLLIPTGIGIVVLLIWYLKCKGELLQIKDGEILFETGLLSKDRIEITMKSVRTVKVSQSFTDRIFGGNHQAVYRRRQPRVCHQWYASPEQNPRANKG